jgi:hypothetical protein
MDDMALWSDSSTELSGSLQAARQFLATELRLEIKPEPYINRTKRGMDLLGCRVFPSYQVLNARSRRRFRRKLCALHVAGTRGELSELETQQRSQALVAYTRTPGLKSWRLRSRVIEDFSKKGHGQRPRLACFAGAAGTTTAGTAAPPTATGTSRTTGTTTSGSAWPQLGRD